MDDKLYRVHSATRITLGPEAARDMQVAWHDGRTNGAPPHSAALRLAEGGEVYDDEGYYDDDRERRDVLHQAEFKRLSPDYLDLEIEGRMRWRPE